MSSAPLRLLIEKQAPRIIDRFVFRVIDSDLPRRQMSKQEIVDHLFEYLAELVFFLRAGEPRQTEVCGTARHHGDERWHEGYELKSVVVEYGLLRAAICEVAEEAGATPSIQEMVALGRFFDIGIAEAVAEFVEQSSEQLHAALDQARRSAQAREDMLAVVSHDLQTPLSTVLGSADALARELGVADLHARRAGLKSKVERIQRASGRMTKLIADLLDVARMTAGEMRLRTAEHRTADLVKEACEQATPLAERHLVHLRAVVPPECKVTCDRERILQVLANLIDNAIKFAPEGSAVTVRGHGAPDACTFEVRDLGPGIPADRLPHLFDRFWRAPDAKTPGTGLGLAIAKGFVELHGGKIWAESRPGEGAAFSFSLPRTLD